MKIKKNITTIENLKSHWENSDKRTSWLLIGGGITLDCAAFVASLLLCTYQAIPSTLLAMLDVSVGGKQELIFFPMEKFIRLFLFS